MIHSDACGKAIERCYAETARFFARRVGSDADDLTQETMTSCVVRLKTLRGPSLRAFVRGIARHKLYDYLRRKQRAIERCSDVDPDELVAVDPEPIDVVDPALLARLRRFPRRDRALLQRHYWGDWPIHTIAAREGKSEGVIRGRLHRARVRLAGVLAGEDRDCSRMALANWAADDQ